MRKRTVPFALESRGDSGEDECEKRAAERESEEFSSRKISLQTVDIAR
jgi:hypothetical protein